MPPRRSIPTKIWDLPVNWTQQEQDDYLNATESKQDTSDINKYLETRGKVESSMYDEIVIMQLSKNVRKDRFTLQQFKLFFNLMKKLFNSDNRFRIRTHLVLRSDKMMKIFLEDFQDEIRLTMSFYKLRFNGNNWEVPPEAKDVLMSALSAPIVQQEIAITAPASPQLLLPPPPPPPSSSFKSVKQSLIDQCPSTDIFGNNSDLDFGFGYNSDNGDFFFDMDF